MSLQGSFYISRSGHCPLRLSVWHRGVATQSVVFQRALNNGNIEMTRKRRKTNDKWCYLECFSLSIVYRLLCNPPPANSAFCHIPLSLMPALLCAGVLCYSSHLWLFFYAPRIVCYSQITEQAVPAIPANLNTLNLGQAKLNIPTRPGVCHHRFSTVRRNS